MAFERKFLSRIGGSGESNAVWIYASTEAVAVVLGANFFDPAGAEINKGDVMFVVDRAEPGPDFADCTISFCVSNNGTVVGMASGTAVGNS